MAKFNNFQRLFGNDEVMIISVYNPKGILNRSDINVIENLSQDMWKVQGVIDVESLTEYHHPFNSGDDEILIEKLFTAEMNDILFRQRSELALKTPSIKDYLIDKNGKLALIYAKQKPYFETGPHERAIVEETQQFVNKYQKNFLHLDFKIAGGLTVGNAYREVAESDLIVLLPIMFALIALILFYFFRSILLIFIPFIITIFSTSLAFALASTLNMSFNNILGLIPQTLMAISIADSVHTIASYLQFQALGFSPKEALKKALHKNFYPTILTTVSTCIGFLSFLTAYMEPLVNFGLLSAFGTLAAWFCTYLSAPLIIFLSGNLNQGPIKSRTNHFPAYVNFLARFKNGILITCTFISLFCLYLGVQNEINTNPIQYFKKNVPARVANDFILEHLGALPGPEIVIDSQVDSGVYDPDLLRRVEVFSNWLESTPAVTKVNSILNVIKTMNQVLNGGRENQYRIAEKRESIAEDILLYQMGLSQGKSINDKLSLNQRYLRLGILWKLQNSKESIEFIEEIKLKAKELGLSITVTGKNPLFLALNSKVSLSLVSSLGLALVLVSLFLLLTFKSYTLAIISIIPNVIPLAIGGAVMYLAGIPLSIGSALVFAVCLGIVVDDTIHFLMTFKEIRKNEMEMKDILAQVLFKTGTPIIITSVILSIGFGLFVFAQFNLNIHFGLISASIFLSALVTDLFLLPALLLKFYKNH